MSKRAIIPLGESRDPHRVGLSVAVIYLAVCSAWIVISDRVVEFLATSQTQMTELQTLKGWAFVLLTAGLLYVIIRRVLSITRKSEVRLKLLSDQALAGVFIVDDGRIVDANQRLLDMLGYDTREELLSTAPEDLVHSDDLEQIGRIEEAVRGGGAGSKLFRIRIMRRSGEEMFADLVAGQIEFEGTSSTMGLLLDSTEQVLLEEQFRRAQRMEALGQLTGAVAHDFNNLLTAIIGPLEISLAGLSRDHPNRDDLGLALETAERAASLSRQLLTFSKKRITRRRVFDLNEPLAQLRALVERITGDRITTRFDLAEDVLPVILDESQLEQVLVNLVINANDAMPDGGVLEIRTYLVPSSSEILRHRGDLVPGAHAVLEVSDTGMGISEDMRLQIFEPFFTTKTKGTGLGLSTVFGIVDQAGGFVRVDSEPGQGATFRVFLPTTDRPLDVPDAGETKPVSEARGGEHVLVVEDENAVSSVISRVLKRAGYTIDVARDGESAIRIWEGRGGKIDLLLTDLMLPGMTGVEIAERLRTGDPSLPVLFTSGYSEEDLTAQVAESSESMFLEKPFTVTALEQKVREALAGGALDVE